MNKKDYSETTTCEYLNKRYDGECKTKDCKFFWLTKDKVVCCKALKDWIRE